MGCCVEISKSIRSKSNTIYIIGICKTIRIYVKSFVFAVKYVFNMTYFSGDYPSALKLFEKGQTNLPQKRDHDEQCLCGIARCSLKTGDIRR